MVSECGWNSDFEGSPMHGNRPTVSSLRGVVAAAHPHAARAGVRILEDGGNAFDAAVATAAALNVVEPYMSSFGGMGLATCWIAKEQRVRTLNFVPPIPSAFPFERFSRRDELQRGALAVGTPGNLAGWAELNRRYGKVTFARCLEQAIGLARDGYPVTEFNVEETNVTASELSRYPSLYGPWKKTYTDGSGQIRLGWVLRQPDLARTLEAIAAEGPELLYGGSLGRKLVEHLQSQGGTLRLSDLEAMNGPTAPSWSDPTTVRYRHLSVNVPPPPCEGFQFLLALRLLDGCDLGRLQNNGLEHLDCVLRAIRLAAGERIAHNNPSPSKLAELLGDAHVQKLRSRLMDGAPVEGPTEQWVAPAPGDKGGEHHTTSFSIADADGNLVCITQSIGSPFGCGVIVPGTGLTLNNFLYWADVQSGSPNRSKPGAHLPMCMAPSISTADGKPVLALGTPGSYGILQTQVQALVQHVDFGHSIQSAIEQPRCRLMDGRVVHVETRVRPEVVSALRYRGHGVLAAENWTMLVGGMQGVAIDPATGVKTGGADPRRDGYVVPV
jgi:gamma-glutamyltranspeptidase/glutathione hydrolase